MSLTCYGGVDEIGGNKIIVRDGDTRFSFDFGTSFKRRYDYFEEYLKPRPGVGLRDIVHGPSATPGGHLSPRPGAQSRFLGTVARST